MHSQSRVSLLAAVGSLIAALLVCGCAEPDRSGTVKIGGSSLMAPITEAWVKALKNKPHPLPMELSSDGSTSAIERLLTGELDVATSSRRIKTEELLTAQSRGVKIEESYAGFLIYTVLVHPSNPVTSITTEQLTGLFTRKIKDWSELGGPKQPISAVYRRVKPGEYDHFFERVVQRPGFRPDPADQGTVVIDNPPDILAKVASSPLAAGYLLACDLGQGAGVKVLTLKRTPDDKPAQPTVAAALEGSYPLLRPLYLYINRASPKPVRYFRDFVLGDEGRQIATNAGMVPLPKRRGEVDASRFTEMLSW
ncbi:MAG: PstS family phosphate ABC transporter substrate-binding protein [Candidatus Riflebacteria bacterium]|nr:PstS family phosphate ABC transporter substrate-binding protein [Candidatus Riflebacteria bacterium]